jgi:hypothetical protein
VARATVISKFIRIAKVPFRRRKRVGREREGEKERGRWEKEKEWQEGGRI